MKITVALSLPAWMQGVDIDLAYAVFAVKIIFSCCFGDSIGAAAPMTQCSFVSVLAAGVCQPASGVHFCGIAATVVAQLIRS